MTREQRRRLICQKLSTRIGEVAPPGLGRWGPAWDLVADPSDRFLVSLDAFLDSDTPHTRREIQHAADEVVRAWRRAGRRWEDAGHPRPRHVVPA